MIIGFFGELGVGKTLSAVIQAYQDYANKNLKVFSNIWLNFPHKPIKTPYDLLEVHNGSLLLDELWHLADSRRTSSLLNDVIGLLLLRSRKRNFNVYYTQQYFLQVDIRVRYITDYWVKPKMIGNILQQRIYDNSGRLIRIRQLNAYPFYDLYNSYSDPYTVKELIKANVLKKLLSKLKEGGNNEVEN